MTHEPPYWNDMHPVTRRFIEVLDTHPRGPSDPELAREALRVLQEDLAEQVRVAEEAARKALTETEFLLARIAEDEAVASHGDGGLMDGARFSSGRVLAECEAKRRIVGDHCWHDDVVERTTCWECQMIAPCATVLNLAAVYSDHPDYREEWKP